MTDVQIRQARADDLPIIKQMVKDERLDPTSLNWPQFLIAEKEGEIAGIGQMRPYPKCRELGSLIVKKDYRGTGVGGLLVRALLANETGDVYLECLSHNEGYYAKFGFERIQWWRAPMPLKLKAGMGNIFGRFMGMRVVTMKREQA